MRRKSNDVARICLLNFSGFTLSARSLKDNQLRKFMEEQDVDVILLPEANVCWHKMYHRDRLHERTFGWFEDIHRAYAYNYKDSEAEKRQYGGVVILTRNNAASRVMESGKDDSGLGRWVWVRYRGRNGIATRIICCYRPCVPSSNGSTGSVYAQHQRHFNDKADDICPREAFTRDLGIEIQSWLDSGDQLILGLDANEDMRRGPVARMLREKGMSDAVMALHGMNAPPTTDFGSSVIDGLWVSPTLQPSEAGYLACGEAVPRTDHRCLWFDISYQNMYGHILPALPTFRARRLKLNDPRVVKKFNDAYEKFISTNKLDQRAFALQQRCTYPMSQEMKDEFEAIDKMKVEGIQHADKACRKLFMGAVPFSDESQLVRDSVGVWQLIIKKKSGRRISTRLIQRQAAKAGMDQIRLHDTTYEDAVEKEREAHMEWKNQKKGALLLRDSFLDRLVEAKAATGTTSKSSIIKSLKTREEIRRSNKRIDWAYGKSMKGGISHAIAPNDDGEWVEVSTQFELEEACMKENEAKFRQANNTPFMTSPLLDDFGYLPVGPNANSVLRGDYQPPPDADPYAVRILQQLQVIPEVLAAEPVSNVITTQQYIDGWRKSKEKTSCGSTILNFAHFKAGILRPRIADFEATMIHIPYSTGYSPQRYQEGIDAELLKKPNQFRIDKLRTIVMYQPDFNETNKLLGKTVMNHIESLNIIASEQYGGRKNKSAIMLAINKVLNFDHIRTMKIIAALCSNDLVSCYDRIIHMLTGLILRSKGVPEPPIVCMLSSIQNLKHSIRTAFGDSALTYGGDAWLVPLPHMAAGNLNEGPLQGVGQGNGAGPMMWAVISTPILEIMRDAGFGSFFKASISGEQIRIVGYAFVDDTDQMQSSRHPTDTFADVADYMQQGLSLFAGLMNAAGQCISPEKSLWYLVNFEWKNGNYLYSSIEQAPADVQVKDKHGVMQTLQRLEPHESRRSLGVYSAPDGNSRDQVAILRATAEEWSEKVRTGHLPQAAAWIALTTRIMKTIEYPLPACTLTLKQCDFIMSPIIQTALNALGICRNMPHDVVYGPKKYQGFGLKHPYTTMGITHLRFIMEHCRSNSDMGKNFRINLECTKLEVGVGGSILSNRFRDYCVLATNGIIKHTWQFLAENEMELHDNVADLVLRRERDAFLIDAFRQRGYKGKALRHLNLCRLFLQVSTLSDIANGFGTYITTASRNGLVDNSRPHYYTYPNQGPVPNQIWDEWRAALSLTFCGGHSSMRLITPLGQWVDDDLPKWTWFYSPNEHRVYERRVTDWGVYRFLATQRNGRHKTFVYSNDSSDRPPDLQRATIIRRNPSRILCTGWSKEKSKQSVEINTTLEDAIESLPSSQQWAFQHFKCTDNGLTIAEAIRQGTAIAVSDGSFKNELGTAAFVIEGKDQTNRILAGHLTPGPPLSQSSFRSELSGLYGIVSLVNTICQFHHITEGKACCACDGKQAIEQAFADPRYFTAHTSKSDYDILSAIHTLIKASPIQWEHKHVKGHQDDTDTELDRWAQLNIEMDGTAKAIWALHQDEQPPELEIEGEYWPLYIVGFKVTGNLDDIVTDHIHGSDLLTRWVAKERIPDDACRLVNWEACGSAIKSMGLSRGLWMVKHISGMCGVNVMMKLWKKRDSDACPRCGETEDAPHVWWCQQPEARLKRAQGIHKLSDWLEKEQTSPEIALAISSRLNTVSCLTPPVDFDFLFPGVQQALEDQDFIGWNNFLEGCIAKTWTETQQKYYEWLGCRKTGRRWTEALIRKLSEVAWDMWEHRNHILHAKENEDVLHNMIQVDAEITYLWRQGHGDLPPRERYLFSGSLEDLLQSSVRNRKLWLTTVTSAMTMGDIRREVSNASIAASRNLMQHWLQGGG